MTEQYFCWKCGTTLADLILPLSRRELCKACNADQHVCKMCLYYQPQLKNMCDEDRADPPVDKERVNFCDYFKPAPDVRPAARQDKLAAAKSELEALFGDRPSLEEPLEPLLEIPQTTINKEKALEDLNKLFGGGD